MTGDTGDSSFVFDESVIRTYDITVAPADWSWLNDNATLEQYVPATLDFEGQDYGQVAIRYKGGFGNLYSCFDGQGNRICDKLSIKLKFSEYDPEGRFYGLKRINLHSMDGDPSKMRDALSYKLFRDNGVYAPRTAYARIVVNGELLGLYAVVEQIDGRFTRSRYPDGGEGNLYKEVWPVHDQPQPYLSALKTNEDENPSVDKMIRFAADLEAADETTLESVLESWTDLDMLMRYMAVARLVDHWDGIVAWYCVGGTCFNHNYYFYESALEDRVWLIPWDLDNTFDEPSPVRTFYGMPDWDEVDASCQPIPVFLGITGLPPSCDNLLRGMATVLWPRYVAASREVLDGDFQISALHARIDTLEQRIADAVTEDPHVAVSSWQSAVNDLRQSVVAKREYIEAKIGSPEFRAIGLGGESGKTP